MSTNTLHNTVTHNIIIHWNVEMSQGQHVQVCRFIFQQNRPNDNFINDL